ncbi:MAG: hypothetical protein LBE13_07495 [Bacteroidales bacterium]|jgi:predicted helicase|nr:hypothetical protein [Bacteroidales bacterium]
MMNLFEQIVWKCRIASSSKRDKGYRFECLMLSFFSKTYPLYEREFSNTWLWNEFPLKRNFIASKKDLDVDLTFYTKRVDCLVVQYKCYKKYAAIDKLKLDSLLSTSNRSFYNIQETGREVNFVYCLDRRLPKLLQSGGMDRRIKSYLGVEAK